MKKLLLLTMAVLTLALSARAADGEYFYVDGLGYRVLSETDRTVSLTSCSSEIREVNIPASVSHSGTDYSVIEISNFYSAPVTSVTIPNSVTKIGYSAFAHCENLTSVTIPNSVTEIGDLAFSGCSSLKSIDIPNSVKEIGRWTFEGCMRLKSVTIPNSVTTIGHGAFYLCVSLKSVTIPKSVIRIGGRAFFGCSSLETIDIPNSVAEMGAEAFTYCSSLISVNISSSIIEERAFFGCTNLESVIISNSVREIWKLAFFGCHSLTSVTIPESVEIIDSAFANCSSLEEIIVDEGNPYFVSENGCLLTKDKTFLVRYFGKEKGRYEIPSSVTGIDGYAFAGCRLSSVSIPSSVDYIGEGAFGWCGSLKIWMDGPNYASIDGCLFNNSWDDGKMTRLLHCAGNMESYEIPESVQEIDPGAFAGGRLTSVTIPNSVTNIGFGAFSCSNLSAVTIPDKIKEIGMETFAGCDSLTSVTIPSSVESIREKAFYGCHNIKNIYAYPHYGPGADYDTFEGVSHKTVIYIPKGCVWGYRHWSEDLLAGTYPWYFTDFREMDSRIDEVETDAEEGPAEYYNLNGMRVSGDVLAPGIYIKRQGGKASKVLVK